MRRLPYAADRCGVCSGRRHAILEAASALRYAAGNFTFNDKPTRRTSSVSSRLRGARASGYGDYTTGRFRN